MYMKTRGIPFTKGYDPEFDLNYKEKSQEWKRDQAVERKTYSIESDIEMTQGLALMTKQREREIAELFEKEKYSFEEPGVLLDPYGMTPLCAYVLFYTEQKRQVRFHVKGKVPEASVTEHIKRACRWHRVPVYGLYSDMENIVSLEILDEQNKVIAEKEIRIKTEPLSQFAEDVVRVQKKTVPSSMKLILVAGKSTSYPVAFDEYGDIRYILKYRPRGYGLFELANGRFIMMERQTLIPTYLLPHSTQMYEIDYFGRVRMTYYVPSGIHHDVCEMTPGGNLLIVSNSQCGHVEDCIAEVNRHNGKIEKFLDLREVLYTAYRDRTNWIHINSLEYEPETGNVIFSARNLHSVMSINWKTNKLNWILGEKNFWQSTPWFFKVLKTPENMPWHFQQHSAKRIWENLDGDPNTKHIIMFDNHWNLRRKIPAYDNDEQSYATIYTIDEKKKTAKIEKRIGGIKSKITSNAVLKYADRRIFYMGGYLAFPEEHEGREAVICEHDYDTGEELNRYSLKYYFFRAFEMKLNVEALAEVMDFPEEPCVGWLKPFVRMPAGVKLPEKMIEEAPLACQEERVRLRIEDGNLWVKSRDHLIGQVFLIGEKECYVKDFREPKRQQDLAAEMEYYLSIPLYSVQKGTYTVAVEFKGEAYNTGKSIRIF